MVMTSLLRASMRVIARYRDLEEETGQATGFNPVGFIELAPNADRLEDYRRIATFNRAMGVDVKEISAKEVNKQTNSGQMPPFVRSCVPAGTYWRVPYIWYIDKRETPTHATRAHYTYTRTPHAFHRSRVSFPYAERTTCWPAFTWKTTGG